MVGQYIITVEFQLHSEKTMNKFFEYVSKNAADSLRLAPGCLRFDVLIPKDSYKTIFLYEIYKNKEAFKNQLKTGHFKIFDSIVKDLIASKTVKEFYTRIVPT